MNKPDSKEKNIQSTDLGKLGEKIAEKILLEKKYKNVINLNDLCPNAPYADIYAEKEGKKLIISVKTRRRKTDINRKGNNSYNLSGINNKRVKLAKKKFNLKLYWIAVTIDNPENKWVYSVYFGSLAALNGSKSISIKKCREGEISRECWIKEGTPLTEDWDKEVKRIFKKD